jgi:phospholipid/cholesterol/gamma-HCH transport system substrate-binding protein
MTAYRRNVAVGLTVLLSLGILAAMLLKFGGTTVRLFKPGQEIDIHFVSSRADGLAEGAPVKYQGVSVGRITRLRRAPDGNGVITDVAIDTIPALPGNVEGFIRTEGLIGGNAVIALEIPVGKMPSTEPLRNDQTLNAKFIGNDLIPQQFNDLAAELERATKNVNVYLSDEKTRTDIQTAIANFRSISESVNRSSANVEKFSNRLTDLSDQSTATIKDARDTITASRADIEHLSVQINDRMLQVSKTLDQFQAITSKINNGQGTVGMLINDPKLYNNLVETSRELNDTIAVLKRLVEQWEQEGISFKLK